MSEENRHDRKKRFMQSFFAATMLISVGVAEAQTEGTLNDQVLEEIVVRGVARQYRPDEQTSATGLNMRLIETPQSISVLTAEILDTIGASNAYEALDIVPGVNRSGFGFGTQRLTMRGVFLDNYRINGIQMENDEFAPHSFLMERVEVVRGPATVVYGVTGSFGGEINNILKRPEEETLFLFGAEGGSYDSRRFKLDVTGALSGDGRVKGRLVTQVDDLGLPYDIRNQDPRHEEINWMASVSWDITSQTSATFWYSVTEREMDPVDGAGLARDANGALALPNKVFPDRVDPETWYFGNPDFDIGKTDAEFFVVEVGHSLNNGWTLNGNLVWDKFDRDISQSFPFGRFDSGVGQTEIFTFDETKSSENITLNASMGGDFDMFNREHSFFTSVEYLDTLDPSLDSNLNSIPLGIADIDIYADGVFDGVTARFADGTPYPAVNEADRLAAGRNSRTDTDQTDIKISAQVLLKPTDRLQILAGVLFHDSDTTVTDFSFDDPNPPTVRDQDASFEETKFRFGVTYDIANDLGFVDDARVYVSYSEGFNPQVIQDTDTGSVEVIPQEMEQVEVGLKAEFLDSAVGASLAYYDYEITNLTTNGISIGNFQTINRVPAGTQDAEGIELDIIGEILPGWNLAFNYAYTDAVISDPAFSFTTEPRTVPEHVGALTTSYEFLQGTLEGLRFGFTYKVSGDYQFVDSLRRARNIGAAGLLRDNAHDRLDLNLSYDGFTGRLEGLRLYAMLRNVFDEEIMVAKSSNPGFGQMFTDQRYFSFGFTYGTL